MNETVVVTGMAVNTVIGDQLCDFFDNLLAGKSGIGLWERRMTDSADDFIAPVGGDLSEYDIKAKINSLSSLIPNEEYKKLLQMARRLPWNVMLSVIIAVEAWLDAYAYELEIDRDLSAIIVAGHNLNLKYRDINLDEFHREPSFIDSMFNVYQWDTTHAACISEILNTHGTIQTTGATCASGNLAIRAGIDEIRYHSAPCALVVGSIVDLADVDIQGFSVLNALSQDSFNHAPDLASRPFDANREGFVPSHASGALVLESLTAALKRRARIYGEIIGVETSSDANYMPNPSSSGQALSMKRVLQRNGIKPEEVDYINGHFTSTPAGDMTEIRAIKEVFGKHAYKLKMNSTKSIIGHSLTSSAIVELIASFLQMNAGKLHPSINIDNLDPFVDLDVCRGMSQNYNVNIALKNSFGFGGINSSCLIRRWPVI